MPEGKSEYPSYILAAAAACYDDLPIVYYGWSDVDGHEAIARVILAERQRCAKIADDEADKLKLRDGPDKRRDPLNKQIVAMKVVCRDIAASIRGELNHD